MKISELNNTINQIKKNIRHSFVNVRKDISRVQKTNSRFIERFRGVEIRLDGCVNKKQLTEQTIKSQISTRKSIENIQKELKKREDMRKEFKRLGKNQDKLKEIENSYFTREEFNIFQEEIIEEMEGLKERLEETNEKAITELELNKEVSKIRSNIRKATKIIDEIDEIKAKLDLNKKIYREIVRLNKKADLLLKEKNIELSSQMLEELEKKPFLEKLIEFFKEEEQEVKPAPKSNKKKQKKVTKKTAKR